MPAPYHYNCHTHIFTRDNVPERFTRRMRPPIISPFRLSFLIQLYRALNPVYNKKLATAIRTKDKIWFTTLDILSVVFLDKLVLLIWYVIKWIVAVILGVFRFDAIFSEESKEFLERIRAFARYSLRKSQGDVFRHLRTYYDDGTRFIVLPMDMEHMAADDPKQSYQLQIEELEQLRAGYKDTLLPFAFVDPRATYPDSCNPSLLLQDKGFYGLKIYPALGYFPFEIPLLKHYQNAADQKKPVMTHCSQGPVYYRGRKKADWNRHPVLQQYGKEKTDWTEEKRLVLRGRNNHVFTSHFGHPLNYLCLLDKELLQIYPNQHNHEAEYDFSKLKICLAHFGGARQVKKHFNNLFATYEAGYEFDEHKNTLHHRNRKQIWYDASWFKVVIDLIKEFPGNIYTDISYTLSDFDLLPTVRDLILSEEISDYVLFGTDFYMVAQERSEKEIYYTYKGVLGQELFDKVAYENVEKYLYA